MSKVLGVAAACAALAMTLGARAEILAMMNYESKTPEALSAMKAEGGDVVFLDPNSGELLALASRQQARSGMRSLRASTFTDCPTGSL